jgi:hypothetical protein
VYAGGVADVIFSTSTPFLLLPAKAVRQSSAQQSNFNEIPASEPTFDNPFAG